MENLITGAAKEDNKNRPDPAAAARSLVMFWNMVCISRSFEAKTFDAAPPFTYCECGTDWWIEFMDTCVVDNKSLNRVDEETDSQAVARNVRDMLLDMRLYINELVTDTEDRPSGI